jgi:hypothetical protein
VEAECGSRQWKGTFIFITAFIAAPTPYCTGMSSIGNNMSGDWICTLRVSTSVTTRVVTHQNMVMCTGNRTKNLCWR